jgi:hypothetical protein
VSTFETYRGAVVSLFCRAPLQLIYLCVMMFFGFPIAERIKISFFRISLVLIFLLFLFRLILFFSLRWIFVAEIKNKYIETKTRAQRIWDFPVDCKIPPNKVSRITSCIFRLRGRNMKLNTLFLLMSRLIMRDVPPPFLTCLHFVVPNSAHLKLYFLYWLLWSCSRNWWSRTRVCVTAKELWFSNAEEARTFWDSAARDEANILIPWPNAPFLVTVNPPSFRDIRQPRLLA